MSSSFTQVSGDSVQGHVTLFEVVSIRVSEPACFGTAPGIFNPEPAPAPGKREQKFGFFLN